MARSILAAVRRIKTEVAHWLTPKAIEDVCSAVGHVWRNRVLDPVTTVHLFVLQILHGNTACAHVPRLGDVRASGEAYGQARAPGCLWLSSSACSGALSIGCAAQTWTMAGGAATAPFWPTAPACRCRTRRRCKSISASRACRRPGAAFPSCTCWPCSMPPLVCSSASWRRRCGPTTCRRLVCCTRS